MKIIKEDEEKSIIVYEPDEREKGMLADVSFQIIDLMESYNLDTDQCIHLLGSLTKAFEKTFNVKTIYREDSE